MTPDQRFSITIAGLGLLWLVMSAVVLLLWRAARTYGVMSERQAAMAAAQLRTSDDLTRIALGLDQRILWLERERRAPGGPPW